MNNPYPQVRQTVVDESLPARETRLMRGPRYRFCNRGALADARPWFERSTNSPTMLVGPRPARPVRNRRVRAKILLVVVVGLAVGVGIALVLGTRGSRNAPPPSGLQGPLHVRGAQLLDAMGRPLQLRGAQIQSYNVARTYRTTDWFSQSAFEAMRSWGMNEVRIPFSGCLVTADPGYVPGLVRIVGRAEAAGLYVVLALFSDRRAGCSFDGVPMPHLDSVEEWRQVAST
ncbi:MAG: glycoside hydrolase family 5 protein, partial [Chloroflexi bacterium]